VSGLRVPFVQTIFLQACFLITLLVLPNSLWAASLSVSPRSGTYEVGSTFSIGIVVDSSDKAFNAVSGKLSFPTDTVEVISLSKNASAISLWIQEPSFSNSAGTVSFEGIVLNPGYKGSNARVLTLQLKVKKEGVAPLSFLSGEILANDGVGTSIMSSTGKGSYSLVTKTPVEIPVEKSDQSDEDAKINTSSAPIIISSTHPQSEWSKETTGIFKFQLGDDVTAMRLLLDDQSDSVPAILYQPALLERTIKDIPDGISYLHVQSKNSSGWGVINHYLLQVDLVLPKSLQVVEQIEEMSPAKTKTFAFSAVDEQSGIEHFEVSLDGGQTQFVPTAGAETLFSTPELAAGVHLLTVKAFDRAGNHIENTKEFVVLESVVPVLGTTFVPQNIMDFGKVMVIILSVLVPVVALSGLFIWLLLYLWGLLGGLKRRLEKETSEAKFAVRKSFGLLLEDLEQDVKTLQKTGAKRSLTKEEIKILKRLQSHISVTEAFIYKEISDIEEEVKKIPSLRKKVKE
jgi:hypothetical protein